MKGQHLPGTVGAEVPLLRLGPAFRNLHFDLGVPAAQMSASFQHGSHFHRHFLDLAPRWRDDQRGLSGFHRCGILRRQPLMPFSVVDHFHRTEPFQPGQCAQRQTLGNLRDGLAIFLPDLPMNPVQLRRVQMAARLQQPQRVARFHACVLARVAAQDDPAALPLAHLDQGQHLAHGEQTRFIHDQHLAARAFLQGGIHEKSRHRVGLLKSLLPQHFDRTRRGREHLHGLAARLDAARHFAQRRGLARARAAAQTDHAISRTQHCVHHPALFIRETSGGLKAAMQGRAAADARVHQIDQPLLPRSRLLGRYGPVLSQQAGVRVQRRLQFLGRESSAREAQRVRQDLMFLRHAQALEDVLAREANDFPGRK